MSSPHEPSLSAPTGPGSIFGARRRRRTRWPTLLLLAALVTARQIFELDLPR
ncbi:MAG: hypothetical protein ACE367_00075 [Acidimicrobiales bacterium]